MELRNRHAIDKFMKKHPFSRNAFRDWMQKIETSQWNNFFELRSTFNSADYRKPFVIFNVGGNNIRLLAKILYEQKIVHVYKVGTHNDYNGWKL